MALDESSSEHWEESRFRSVFSEHYVRMVRILVRLLGDTSRAEEVAGEAFWRLYLQPALQANGNLGGWLYRTATNLAIDALRASRRRSRYEESAGQAARAADPRGPLEEVLRAEKCRQVRRVLASIEPFQAQLLILRSSGFSYKELAEALEVKMTSIGTMLNRAEEEFRRRFIALFPDQEEL